MEEIYSNSIKNCELVSTRQEKVKFLLDYSKSLHISKEGKWNFENILN